MYTKCVKGGGCFMPERSIAYLDNGATTPVCAAAVAAAARAMTACWGNPSSPHTLGTAAFKQLEASREQVAAMAGCPPLNRPLLPAEYQQVVAELDRLCFANGWLQDIASAGHYNPDFSRPAPFSD